MKIPRIGTFARESSVEIEQHVKQLLLAAEVGEKLPTPKDDVVKCAELVEIGELDLSLYEEGWFKKGVKHLLSALSKLRGLVDFREEILYVSPDIHPAQQVFVTYHEVTHRILPWHEGLYNPHLDDEYSIHPRLARGLEQEANIGASLIQFQIDRFARELKDLRMGLLSAKYLADRYATSLHSTFRKYVEDNNRACAMMVLKEVIMPIPEQQRILQLWYPLQSTKFTEEFGLVDWGKFYCEGDIICDTAFSRSLDPVKAGEIQLTDLRGFERKCRMEVFYNGFNHFVLIYPLSTSFVKPRLVLVKG